MTELAGKIEQIFLEYSPMKTPDLNSGFVIH